MNFNLNLNDLIAILGLENCIKDVKNWMCENKLKLNDEKTEVILCNPKKYKLNVSEIKVGNDVVKFTDSAKNLGVFFDKDLSLDAHFVHISCYLVSKQILNGKTFETTVHGVKINATRHREQSYLFRGQYVRIPNMQFYLKCTFIFDT